MTVDINLDRKGNITANLDESGAEFIIVEGYGRRRYKQEFIRFLTYSLASCDETTDHLETLYETESLKHEALYRDLHKRLQILGKKTNLFIQSVEKEHRTD